MDEVGRARLAHSKRLLRERLADELGTEELTTDLQKWLGDPERYDFPRVDVESPLRVEHDQHFSPRGWVDGKIEARDENSVEVGYLSYTWTPCDLHLELVSVKPEFRGRGYAGFLVRELVNLQDGFCVPAFLEVWPFAGELVPGRETAEEQLQVLKGLYGSFGFESTGGNKMARMPVCRTKREKERLLRECEGKLKAEW